MMYSQNPSIYSVTTPNYCLVNAHVYSIHPMCLVRDNVKISSYIVQYPVLRTAQSALHFSLWQSCSIKHHRNFPMLQLMHEDNSYIYPPVSSQVLIHKMSEPVQCRVKIITHSFTPQHDSNPGSLSEGSKTLPLTHGAPSSFVY